MHPEPAARRVSLSTIQACTALSGAPSGGMPQSVGCGIIVPLMPPVPVIGIPAPPVPIIGIPAPPVPVIVIGTLPAPPLPLLGIPLPAAPAGVIVTGGFICTGFIAAGICIGTPCGA